MHHIFERELVRLPHPLLPHMLAIEAELFLLYQLFLLDGVMLHNIRRSLLLYCLNVLVISCLNR
jgi:hypothetical protein